MSVTDEFAQILADELADRRREDRAQQQRPPKASLDRTPYGYADEVVIPAAGKKVPAVKRHKQKTTLDVYKHYFREDELIALARFVYDAEIATTVNVTSNYDGVPATAGHRPAGGVGERNRLAYSRFQWITSQLRTYSPNSLDILKQLVLSTRNEQMNRAMTIHEVAKIHAPHLQKREALGAFGAGLLKATAWWLVGLYDQYGKATRPIDQDPAVQQGRRQREAMR